MAGTAAKVIISERQQKLLEEFRKSRTIGKCIVQRATIILLGFTGMLNEDIAHQVGLNRQQVGLWRQRWRDAWKALCVWECTEPDRLREAILDQREDFLFRQAFKGFHTNPWCRSQSDPKWARRLPSERERVPSWLFTE